VESGPDLGYLDSNRPTQPDPIAVKSPTREA